MSLEEGIGQDAVVLRIMDAAKIEGKERKRTADMLKERQIWELVKQIGDVQPVLSKLGGSRIPLDPGAQELVVVVHGMVTYQDIVQKWLETRPSQAYAVEHVLGHYDPAKRDFVSIGPGAELVKGMTFGELQILKKYSGCGDNLNELYSDSKKGNVPFTHSADEVARALIGRILVLPADGLGSAPAVNEWTRYRDGKNEAYKPLELQIVEAEAFRTDQDVSRMRYCMLAAPGQIDVMPFRGLSFFNIGTEKAGTASCVMIRAASIDGEIVEGPGKVGNAAHAKTLIGKVIGKDIPLLGKTAPAGYLPGEGEYSKGRYRMQ